MKPQASTEGEKTIDLHTPGDGLWTFDYPSPQNSEPVSLDQIGVYGDGAELAIISYANGYYLSRQAEKILSEEHGLKIRLIDMRWLAPLPEVEILEAVSPCANILIDLIAHCKLIKVGRTLVVGEVDLYSEGKPELVAHVVGTYAVPPVSKK